MAIAEASLRNLIPVRQGQILNPNGRPKGSRNKLEERFLADLHKDWEEHGIQALEDGRTKDPMTYVKMVASLMPNKVTAENALDGISRDDLRVAIDALRSWIVAPDARAIGQDSGEPGQAIGLPAISEAG